MNSSAAADGISALLGMAMLLPLLLFGFVVLSQGFWIWMIVDSATNPRLVGNDKLMWVLIVVFTNWIGALIYFFAARPRRSQTPPPVPSRSCVDSTLQVAPPPLPVAPVSPDVSIAADSITCPNCSTSSPFYAFRAEADGRGSCPNCGIHVAFE
jgi:hypothetical protein